MAVLGSGPPLLLLHGFDSSLLEFRRLAPLLAQDHQLWIPDLCGFGFGPRPPGLAYGPPLVIAQLRALLTAMPAGPVGLIGASMGGAVAVVLAREELEQQPERQQQVLAMYYVDQLRLREIGAQLHVTESRVCQILREAVTRLRASLLDD